MADFFSTTSSALPKTTRVLAFRGTEALSALYQFELYLLIEETGFDMSAALGADATFSINRDDGQPFLFHGVFSSIETVGDLARGAVYRAVLVPRFWRLTLTRHSRVFVNATMQSVLQTVLDDAGVAPADYSLKLTATYGPEPHVCQYQESRFAFLSRRMEREGIYFFFEHGEDRERLIITDDRSFHEALASDPMKYAQVSGAGAGGTNGFRSFTCKHTSIPGSVLVKDYDYLRPALDVSAQAAVSGGPEEIHLHGENFVTPEEGERIARVRAEELKARQIVFRGSGRVFCLRPGYTFKLESHPRLDGEYLAIEIEHRGNQFGGLAEAKDLLGVDGEEDDVYRAEVVAIPARTQFRPDRRTPMPRIYGTERAVVDGEADHDYAQLDEHGRYLVKIHFDESPAKNGKASARIRMMQPHGGSPESFHFPLRKGTEVLLTFEGGDPDRPLIAGVAPNLVNPTGVTSKNPTRNIIQTGGGNRVQIEDLDGKQHVRLSSPHLNSFLHMGAPNGDHNWIGSTQGNSYAITGQDSETGVGGSRLTVIGDGHGLDANKNVDPNIEAMDPALLTEALEISSTSNLDKAPSNADKTPAVGPDGKPLLEVKSGTSGSVNVKDTTSDSTTPSDVTVGASGTTGSGGVELKGVAPFTLVLNPPDIIQDPDNRAGYKQGSDIKFVGGDNVTKVTNDALSAIQGNSVSHIHGHSFATIGVAPPGTPVPSPPIAGDPAQMSTVYGNTKSTIFGNTEATVNGSVETTINGDRTTTVNGNATTHLKGALHTTTVLGNRVTMLAGTDTSLTAGLKTSAVLGGNISVVIGGDFSLKWPFWMAITAGPHFSMNPVKSSMDAQKTEVSASKVVMAASVVETHTSHIHNSVTEMDILGVHVKVSQSTVEQVATQVMTAGMLIIS